MNELMTYTELARQLGVPVRDIEGELRDAQQRGASRDELRAIVGLPPIGDEGKCPT